MKKNSSFQVSPFSVSFSCHAAGTQGMGRPEHRDWTATHQRLTQIFSSCTQERCGSHAEMLLNLGSDFAELVLLITSNLVFTCSALHTFPLQHQPCAYSVSLFPDNLIAVMWIQIWEERSQGGQGQNILRLKNSQVTGRLLTSGLIRI